MKKKKYQATEQHLIGRDQEMKKKLEFVKTQGTFLRKVLASIEWQTKWTQYIIGCFERSAIQFPIKESSDETTDDAREWASLSDLKRIKQLRTQEQMKEICQSIVNDMNSNKSYIPPRKVWSSTLRMRHPNGMICCTSLMILSLRSNSFLWTLLRADWIALSIAPKTRSRGPSTSGMITVRRRPS